MLQGFLISHEKGGMEDRMNLPLRGDVMAEGHAGDDFLHFQRAILFCLKFFGPIHVEVCHLKPDFVSNFPGGGFGSYLCLHFLLGHLVGSLSVVSGRR